MIALNIIKVVILFKHICQNPLIIIKMLWFLDSRLDLKNILLPNKSSQSVSLSSSSFPPLWELLST